MEIYLDNSATTRICSEAEEKMIYIIRNVYGNPSSLHSIGIKAQGEFNLARRAVAESLGVSDEEIFFTSGGTEANNLAVFGAARARKKRGNKIVTTAVEHSSVLESCRALEEENFEVVYIKPEKDGCISVQQLSEAIDENTVLVSVMMVNNETGAVFPVECIREIVERKNSPALIHCDAVQAYGKTAVKPKKIKCDLLTVSAHKIHGPKGTGALYVNSGVHIKPLIYGGEQQEKIRPGTEALPLICGFGKAARNIGDVRDNYIRMWKLREYAAKKLLSIDGVVLNSPMNSLPCILNVSAVGVRSETMLHYLEKRGIFISSGSACAKGKKSHVLTAMGLSPERIDSALRISFSRFSGEREIDELADGVEKGLKELVKSNYK